MNLGGGRKGIRSGDTNMIKLVEEYLVQNSERTYIDMEDMIAELQTKSFHFSRMKKQAFSHLVRNAYYQYCNQNQVNSEDHTTSIGTDAASADPGPVVTAQTVVDSDSDVEIEEPVRTAMSNQLTGLYQQRPQGLNAHQPASASTSRPLPGPIAGRPFTSLSAVRKNHMGVAEGNTAPRNPNSPLNIHVNPKYRGTEQLQSSSGSSSSSDNSMLLVEPLDEDKDDDDLEIIEEFSSANSSHPSGNLNSVLPRRGILQQDKTDQEQLNEALRRGSKALPTSIIGAPISVNFPNDKGTQALIPEKIEQDIEESKGFGVPNSLAAERKGIKRSRAVVRAENANSNPSSAAPGGLNKAQATPKVKSKPEETGLGNFNKKIRNEVAVINESNYTHADFGGNEKAVKAICRLSRHLKNPQVHRTVGMTPARGILLHGPPGCGKTLLANVMAGELKIPMLQIVATELISGISGESENNIRDIFDQALSLAPCIIFIDEVDSIAPKRETAQRQMELRIVTQLGSSIDGLKNKEKGDQILLIGATNRIETIDPALRRAGRFDREICLGIPNQKAREEIFRVLLRGLKLEDNFNFELLAKLTPGYVGADVQDLVAEAYAEAVDEIISSRSEQSEEPMDQDPTGVPVANAAEHSPEVVQMDVNTTTKLEKPIIPSPWEKWLMLLNQKELETFCLRMKDFERALKNVQPTSKREGFAMVPDTTWDDIGALKKIRHKLEVSILGPLKHPSAFEALGMSSPSGVLLCGPPGCGKTLLAKAVANEASINFISVKGPELFNMYVGETERAVRQCFLRAKNSSPCVIFFDEIDALCPRRSDGDSNSSSRVVNQLLTEMDGMESRLGVFIMAATNRPDILDPAILRPGRLDKTLFIGLPSASDRIDILKALTKCGTKPALADDVNIEDIGNNEKCENFTGADLTSLIREARDAAYEELVVHPEMKNEAVCPDKDLKVYQRHFDFAFTQIKPSVSKKDREMYDRMQERYSSLSSQR